MIYYRCDLCGREQELSKVEPTVADPCANGTKLPHEVASKIDGVKDVCMCCYRTVMLEEAKIYKQAKIDANQAMFVAATKLLA